MKVLVTGADGFIGKTLTVRLGEQAGYIVERFIRGENPASLLTRLGAIDAIVHLAGENRPEDPAAFMAVNGQLTERLCDAVRAVGRPIPILFASSTQAELDNPYGASKRVGEAAVMELAEIAGQSCKILRLPNVFGKWARPNYNSAIATFCHNIARDLPIRIDNPDAPLALAYVDDVVQSIIDWLGELKTGLEWGKIEPVYLTTVGEVAAMIQRFHQSRETLTIERVGAGLTRALYATYVSYLPSEHYSYVVPVHGDERGVFVEMLKTQDSGQFSFFTIRPGITRGRHYHHSKTEKFLVIKGHMRFNFRHILTDEFVSLDVDGSEPRIVESIPGWSHDITNIGHEEGVVMLWANEIFDRQRPDTIARSV
jgi:UDP-2-acetamido-2,6-beta-L-arabino-hexul-4-ose reductase